MSEREPWAVVKVTLDAAGDDLSYVVSVPLYAGDDFLSAVEQAGSSLVTAFAEQVAARLSRPQQNGSIVDHTVDRLDRLNEQAKNGMQQVAQIAGSDDASVYRRNRRSRG